MPCLSWKRAVHPQPVLKNGEEADTREPQIANSVKEEMELATLRKENESLRSKLESLEIQTQQQKADFRESIKPSRVELREVSEAQILRGIQSRNESFLLGVFNDFKEADTNCIERGKVVTALKAAHVDTSDEARIDDLLQLVNSESNHSFSFEEFKRVASEPTEIDHIFLSISPHLILADAVLRRESDPLTSFLDLTSEDVDIMLDAARDHLKAAILESCSKLKNIQKDIDENQKQMTLGNAKFSCFTMSAGTVDDFHEGLGNRVGAPHLKFLLGMEMEHKLEPWSTFRFTSSNYGITTCPEDEWGVVLLGDEVRADMRCGRRVQRLEELEDSALAKLAGLIRAEVAAVVLYTGPMFTLYNAILRRFPADLYQPLADWGNLFATSIHVLVSAIQKITRASRLPDGLTLYRGLGGALDLPLHFRRADARGCRGFAEWGFMSTTSQREVALSYSGVREGRQRAAILQLQVGAVDRGACVRDFSQYPGEVEYLFLPLSFVAPAGPAVYEATAYGLVRVVPVRINANVKPLTTDQMLERKKQNHVACFHYLVDELRAELLACAHAPEAARRWAADTLVSAGGRSNKPPPEALARDAVAGLELVLNRQRGLDADYFVDNFNYRAACEEMLGGLVFARSKWAYWLACEAEKIEVVMGYDARTCHRLYCAQAERRVRAMEDGPARRAEALALCQVRGLVREAVDEVAEEGGETPLQRCAADGRGAAALELLVLAGAEMHRSHYAVSALFLAAQYGQAESVRALAALGGRVDEGRYNRAPPIWIAALNGHTACVVALCEMGAQVDLAADNGCTALYVAAEFGHGDCVLELAARGADVNRMEGHGMTPAFIAALNGHRGALEALHEAKADLNLAKPANGCTPAYVAAEFGHLDCLRALAACGADMARANVNGVTPRAKAEENGFVECAAYLAEFD